MRELFWKFQNPTFKVIVLYLREGIFWVHGYQSCVFKPRGPLSLFGVGSVHHYFHYFHFQGAAISAIFHHFSLFPISTNSSIMSKCNYNQARCVLQEKMPNCAHTKNRNIQLQCSYISIQSSSNMAPDLLAALVRAKYNM